MGFGCFLLRGLLAAGRVWYYFVNNLCTRCWRGFHWVGVWLFPAFCLSMFCVRFVPKMLYMPRHLMVLYGKMRFRAVFTIFVSESDAASSGVQVPGGIDA